MLVHGIVALSLAGALGMSLVGAQSIRLDGPLAQPLSGDVLEYEVSPDGARVVYRADQAADGVFELFAAPTDGSAAPVRLHAPLPESSPRDARAFAIGAGERVSTSATSMPTSGSSSTALRSPAAPAR